MGRDRRPTTPSRLPAPYRGPARGEPRSRSPRGAPPASAGRIPRSQPLKPKGDFDMLQIKNPRQNLAAALRQGRLKPSDLRQVADEQDAAEAAAAKAQDAADKVLAAKKAALEKAIPERAAAIVAAHRAIEERALLAAARDLAHA